MQNRSNRSSNALRTIGLAFFVIASSTRLMLHPTASTAVPFDLINGLMYGIAIGCLLLSLRQSRTQSPACGS
jgi:MFS superfamily sulfate permease-like transporter